MVKQRRNLLAIDQGTSSTKTLIFDEQGRQVAKGMEPLRSSYGAGGMVEQDAEEIFENVLASIDKCLAAFRQEGGNMESLVACGISNQRETFVVWDEAGKPLCPAVVWQCKRSASICERLKGEGKEELFRQRTGLLIDPYFSGTKLAWLAENNETVRNAMDSGRAFFGTVDTWLLYRLTNGLAYATDYTNASRTLFFNLETLSWDQDLLRVLGIQNIRLPQIRPSAFFFGETDLAGMLDRPVGITAMIGDSHAAAFGEGCFDTGSAKATLGTGCSILMNIGDRPLPSVNGMMTTICWSTEEKVAYALEGVIVSCGSTVEWLKNELGLFHSAGETELLSLAVPDNGGVYLIPAFSGLGSPHWDMDARAVITGMSFGTAKNHIVRAALESIPYQIADVIRAMEKDTGAPLNQLMINGGMTANTFVMQYIADLLGIAISSGAMPDLSALGAALLAGLKAGVFVSLEELSRLKPETKSYTPGEGRVQAQQGYEGWLAQVQWHRQRPQR